MKHLAWILVIVPFVAACEEGKTPPAPVPPAPPPKPWEGTAIKPPAGEPEHVTVQHILVAFGDAVGVLERQKQKQMLTVTRSRDEAKQLAEKIFDLARTGVTLDELKATHSSDDSGEGTYGLANHGVQPQGKESPRNGMVAAFGDVGFKLGVGEVGLAEYDPVKSTYGWHIIKRVK